MASGKSAAVQIGEQMPVEPFMDAWMIVFEDADRSPMTFTGEGAEQAAHKTFKKMLGAWSCHLFRTIKLSNELAAD